MRKLIAVFIVLLGCLAFVGQAAASTSAVYSDCCLHGCKGMTQCAGAGCQACAAPQLAPTPQKPLTINADGSMWHHATATFDTGLQPKPWTPPD